MAEIRNLDELAAYAQEQIARITQMQQQLTEQTGAGESPSGAVRARTGPGGRLLDLELSASALRMSPEDASAEIVAAVTAAQADYATRADRIMEPVLAMRPSEQATDALDAGMRRLDELTADLERLAARRELDR